MKTILYISLFSLFCSCEHTYNYSYTLTNDADTSVQVSYITKDAVDSVIELNKNETRLFLIDDHGLEGGKGPYQKDVVQDFIVLSVSKNGLNSTRNYLKNEGWTYSEGAYKTTITDSEF